MSKKSGNIGQRIGGRMTALLRRNRRLRRSEGLGHYVRLAVLRDVLLEEFLERGGLSDRKERLLSETNRQIESLGARLGLIPPAPRAGGEAAPEKTLDDYLRG